MLVDSVGHTRFCINCNNVASSSTGDENRFRCFAVENTKDRVLSLITGEKHKILWAEFCFQARKDEALCGQAGKWFKEKASYLQPVAVVKEKSLAEEL